MKKIRYLCLQVFLLLYLLFIFSYNVEASYFEYNEDGTVNEDSDMYKKAKEVRDILIQEGCTEAVAYGILGNLIAESGLKPDTGSTHLGIAQWDKNGRWVRCQGWCNSNGKNFSTREGQTYFLIYEMSHTPPEAGWTNTYINNSDFIKLEDPFVACEYFMVCFERCPHNSNHASNCGCDYLTTEAVRQSVKGGTESRWQLASKRLEITKECVQVFTGVAVSYRDTEGTMGDGGVSASSSSSSSGGALASELELGVTVTDWYDTAIDLPSSNELELSDRLKIASWKQDVEESGTSSAISWIRSVVAFIGILVVVYSALIYVAYWFDRLNNFIEISMLNILTFGRLELSPDEQTSTFSPKTEGKKLIVHKDAIFISLLGIAFGVILLSGVIYDIIYGILNFIQRFIK